MILLCFPQNSCYLWGLWAMNTQNWKFFLAQNWCNLAQNGPKIDPFVFLRKSIQYLFHVFGMKLENQGYSKILCIYWFLFEVLNYPAKSGLKKDFYFWLFAWRLFKTISNYDYSNILNIFFVESFCPKSGQIRPEDDLLDPFKSWRNRKS